MSQLGKVAFLGTGLMGFPMARNLCRAGVQISAWNRSNDKAAGQGSHGAEIAHSAGEAVKGARAVFSMVSDGSATAEDESNLEGARFVFDTMVDSLLYLSAVKEEPFLDRLESEGAPNTVTWEPSEESKGIKALLILGDLD